MILRRAQILLTADDTFLASVKRIERSIWTLVNSSLDSLNTSRGKIVSDEAASQVLLNLRRRLQDTLRSSQLPQAIRDYLPVFDEVEKLQGGIYGRLLEDRSFRMPNTVVAKRAATRVVIDSLRETKGLDSSYIQPLTNQMFTLIETQTRRSEAREALRGLIVGTSPSGGRLSRYSRQVVTDLLNGYDGFIQSKLQQEYNFSGWYFMGSLIKDSRPNCVNLVNGSGWFEPFAIRPGVYATEDIPAIVEIASMPSHAGGWRPETTAATFPIHRCGYNCRHSLLFSDLTSRELNQRLQNIQRLLAKLEPQAV